MEFISGSAQTIIAAYAYGHGQYPYIQTGISFTSRAMQTYQPGAVPPTVVNPAYNYVLKGFNNIIELTISGLWYNADVTQLWITTSVNGLQADASQYCNASLTVAAADRKPYPRRFDCRYLGSNSYRINFLENEVTAADYSNPALQPMSITVYFKQYISEASTST